MYLKEVLLTMPNIQGKHINLRALEPEDINFLYKEENTMEQWEVSTTQAPFSKYLLEQYLNNAHLDIYEAKQLRLVIEHKDTSSPIGLIDLFDFEPQHHRAGIGILISKDFRAKGYAKEALELLHSYCKDYLQLKQLYANIIFDNKKSIQLFTQQGYQLSGTKKDWICYKGLFKDVLLFQKIFS